ncbi:hypothetical protein SAMN02746009_01370 [Hymenobacter psychrotolerans DSM 18569]|uniref:Magnesium citrate secondary transporter n=2 Tax=Hymenobacter psychrotolerans TaxID=344998 RepID=A0A1M6UIG3_9BACT|nr:hypothetical protein SAMN02746009_01370 [Hymenobacter psychrotolerans DSM 18569]
MRRWPAELRHPLFLVGAGLYVLSVAHKRQWLGPWPFWPPLLTSYLADLLTLPLELTLLLWLMRRFYFRNPAFVLPTSWIFSTWLVMAVWFEGLLPRFDARATADPLDVVAYAVGGFLFWRWQNRPAAS